jgi:hypothetical protein
MRVNVRKLIGGLSLLFVIAGLLLICFIHGGLLNKMNLGWGPVVVLDRPGHIVGFILLAIGAVGFVVLYSLERTNSVPHHEPLRHLDRGIAEERNPARHDERDQGQFRVG